MRHLFLQDTGAHVHYWFGIRVFQLTPLDRSFISTNPVKASGIHFSSSQFRKQHRHEKAVNRTSLAEAIYAWPCEGISRERES
ncbi:unnamed protein product [Schistosoma mattheei]|uniref:Uncharacterized protein n=1 Tax=Schistosoma mattheei TaxID=31246 RepID=A0A183PDH2_9TREM|nr:unnamed protein product [Schistosoma mattheei]